MWILQQTQTMGKQETLDGVSIIVNWVKEFLTAVFKISYMYVLVHYEKKRNQRTFSVKRNNDEMTLIGNNLRKKQALKIKYTEKIHLVFLEEKHC